MRILGISCYYHDAAACLISDGRIVAAAEEERFTWLKHDKAFPANAVRYCLAAGGITARDLDHVIFYEKPLLKFERIFSMYTATAPRSGPAFVHAMRMWLGEKLWTRSTIRKHVGASARVLFSEHHLSHAASAFYPSPFDEAAVLTADAVGEWATTTVGVGRGTRLDLLREIHFPHSLGLLYSAFTSFLGFEVNDGEYKVMGMAAYGRPRYEAEVRRLIDIRPDGSYHLDMRYFAYHRSLRMLSARFREVFGAPRQPESALDERYADIAASIQKVLEDVVLAIARTARALTGARYLCLAGGVALNVIANARLLREAGFDDVWIQPAAGDSGGALGAALFLYHHVLGNPRVAPMRDAYLGPSFTHDELVGWLDEHRVPYLALREEEVAPTAARLLAAGEVLGWFQGRMEFGPRALGHRSILADPRDVAMRERVNAKIKHREEFRPFAPVVIERSADDLFDFGSAQRSAADFMLLVARVRQPQRLGAVTHIDGTARVQVLRPGQDRVLHDVLEEMGTLTGVPVLLNTSFNVRGEPIVCTPLDALRTFSRTELDHLFLGRCLIGPAAKRIAWPGPPPSKLADDAAAI